MVIRKELQYGNMFVMRLSDKLSILPGSYFIDLYVPGVDTLGFVDTYQNTAMEWMFTQLYKGKHDYKSKYIALAVELLKACETLPEEDGMRLVSKSFYVPARMDNARDLTVTARVVTTILHDMYEEWCEQERADFYS